MPRAKAKKQDDLTLITPANKKKIYALIVVGAVIGIIVLMMTMKKTAENMINHANDRPKAIQAIIAACSAERESRGLKNAEGIAFANDCQKREIQKLDTKK